jgi:condensin complex subunit 1
MAKDITGTKNVSTFLGELTERLPKHVFPFISLLLIHLENESYTMRNGVIQVITYLIHKALQPQDDQQMDKMTAATLNTRDSLLHLLLERFYDVNAFARSKVIQSWSYLCQCVSLISLFLFLPLSQFKNYDRLFDS